MPFNKFLILGQSFAFRFFLQSESYSLLSRIAVYQILRPRWKCVILRKLRTRILSRAVQLGTLQFALLSPNDKNYLQETLKKLDGLHSSGHHEEEYTELLQLLSTSDNSSSKWEVLWRLSRVAYLLSRSTGVEEKRKSRLLDEAFDYCQRSLQLEEKNPEAHKWYAMVAGIYAQSYNISQGMKFTLAVKQHAEKVLVYEPHDARAHHTLATWCYRIADLNFIERRIVHFLVPEFPTTTFEEALSHFEQADAVCPEESTCYFLVIGAKCYLKLQEKDKALALLDRTKGTPRRTVDDEKMYSEGMKMLKGLQK